MRWHGAGPGPRKLQLQAQGGHDLRWPLPAGGRRVAAGAVAGGGCDANTTAAPAGGQRVTRLLHLLAEGHLHGSSTPCLTLRLRLRRLHRLAAPRRLALQAGPSTGIGGPVLRDTGLDAGMAAADRHDLHADTGELSACGLLLLLPSSSTKMPLMRIRTQYDFCVQATAVPGAMQNAGCKQAK